MILGFIRILFLSLLLCLLLIKSGPNAPILRHNCSSTGCVAISATATVFDLDEVTFAVHHGRPANTDWTHMAYVPYIELYFEANESDLISTNRILLKRTENGYGTGEPRCGCSWYSGGRSVPKVWETFTVPRELFAEDEGCFKFFITAPRTPEMPETTLCVRLYYEKIGFDKIKFSLKNK